MLTLAMAPIMAETRDEPAHNDMKIKVAVNQNEAIRRGFESSSTVRLNVDIPNLSQEVRDFIADRFFYGDMYAKAKSGASRSVDELLFTINQPDIEGLMEAINAELAKAK